MISRYDRVSRLSPILIQFIGSAECNRFGEIDVTSFEK